MVHNFDVNFVSLHKEDRGLKLNLSKTLEIIEWKNSDNLLNNQP